MQEILILKRVVRKDFSETIIEALSNQNFIMILDQNKLCIFK